MSLPFGHPSASKLLDTIKTVFQTKAIFSVKDRHIIFLCGGPVSAHSKSMRNRFIKYSRNSLPEFRIFLAETATQDLTRHNEPEFINLAQFETLVAEIADCIVLFPESPGSFAEVGYFSNSKAIAKLLVVNNMAFQNDSFISLGITDRINSKSTFRQVIVIDYKNPDFEPVRQRLLDRLHHKQGSKFDINKFSKLKVPQKLFVIFQVIYIFRVLSFESIIFCLARIFEDVNEKIVKHLLSILIAANYIERKGDGYDFFVPAPHAQPFLEFRNYEISKLQAEVVLFFEKYHEESYKLLKEITS